MSNKDLIRTSRNDIQLSANRCLNIQKELISHGQYVSKQHSKIKIVPFRNSESWKLYNIDEQIYLDDIVQLENLDNPQYISTFFINNRNNQFYLIDQKANVSYLGHFISIQRNHNYILALDTNKKCYLFNKRDLICKMPHIGSYKSAPSFEIVDNNTLLIKEFQAKYDRKYITGGNWRVIGAFDFNGNEVQLNKNLDEIIISNVYANEQMHIEIQDTLWEIKETGLHYKNVNIYNFINNDVPSSDVMISNFHFGYAFVKVYLDADPEFGGVYYDNIGYIDIYGKYYWK